MKRKIIIEGSFPSMNDIIDAAKKRARNFKAYSDMKRHYTYLTFLKCRLLPKFNVVRFSISWYEKDARRDVDNITAGVKFILDGFVKGKVIKDDSQKYVKSIIHNVYIDKNNPRIEIIIEEIEK